MLNNIDNYYSRDPNEGVALEDILPLSARARALVVRSRQRSLLKVGFINIAGAIEMLAGMEYHHRNLVRTCLELGEGETDDETAPDHEAVAYVNRMGQFYFFAKSALITNAVKDPLALIPTIVNFAVFRMKHSAHRSIDAPKPRDTDGLQWSHARSMSSSMGRMMLLKPGKEATQVLPAGPIDERAWRAHKSELWRKNYLTFQIHDGDTGSRKNLTIETDHAVIASEAYALIQTAIMS
jgi:hypothetical protein